MITDNAVQAGLSVVVLVLLVQLVVGRVRVHRHRALHTEAEAITRLPAERWDEVEARWLALRERCRPHRRGDAEIVLLAAWGLAYGWALRGRLAEAEEQLTAALLVAGPQVHPHWRRGWLARAELADVVVRRGRYAEGVGLARDVAAECAQRWGVDSETALGVRDQLAWCLIEGGEPAEAVVVLTGLRAARQRTGGAAEVDLALRYSLAEARLRLGELDAAEPELRAVLAGLPDDDPISRAGVGFALAEIAARRGDADAAITGYTESLAITTAALGPDAPWALLTRFRLAELTGDTTEHAAVLADRIRVLGPEHPDTAASRAAVSGVD